MRKLSITCLSLCALGAAPLFGQQPGNAEHPVRIRLIPSGPGLKPLVGVKVSQDADTVRLVPSGRADTVRIATASLLRMEQSVGRRSNAGRGAVLGALIGAGVGGTTLGILVEAMRDLDSPPGNAATALAIGTGILIGAPLGAGVGALIGSASSRERWVASPTLSFRRGSVVPTGAGLALRLSF